MILQVSSILCSWTSHWSHRQPSHQQLNHAITQTLSAFASSIWKIDSCCSTSPTRCHCTCTSWCAIAYKSGRFHLAAFFAMIGAILIQIEPITPMTISILSMEQTPKIEWSHKSDPNRTHQTINIRRAFIFTFALVVPIISYGLSGMALIGVGIASSISGILYTGGPKPLGYMGLGDALYWYFLVLSRSPVPNTYKVFNSLPRQY